MFLLNKAGKGELLNIKNGFEISFNLTVGFAFNKAGSDVLWNILEKFLLQELSKEHSKAKIVNRKIAMAK